MAAVRTDKVQIEVEIGGEKVKNTISDLKKAYQQLNRERDKMTVGTEEYIKKTEALKDVTSRLTEVKNETKAIDDANKGAMESFLELTGMDGRVAALSNTIKGTGGNVLGTAKTFTTLRGAIISTGIGALVVLLGSLISYLSTTQEGIDMVTKVTAPLSAIFQRLIGVVQVLGGKVFKELANAVKDPKKALSDLVDFIQNNVLARFQAISVAGSAIAKIFSKDWKQGFKELGDAAIQGTTGIRGGIDKLNSAAQAVVKFTKDGIDIGLRLRELNIQIEKDEINMIRRRKELELIAKQQNYIVEDETKSFDERRQAAEKALAAQVELENMLIALMDKKIEKKNLEHEQNDTLRADDKELAELESERAEMAGSVVEMRTTMRNKLNVLNKAEAADYQKMLDEKRKAREEQEKIELEAAQNILDLKISGMREGLEKEIATLTLDYGRKIEALKGSEAQITEQKLLLEQERQMKLEELQAEFAEKDKQSRQERFDKQLEDNRRIVEMEILELEESRARGLTSEQAYFELKNELEREALLSRMDMLREHYGTESLEYQQALTQLALLDKTHQNEKVENERKAQEQKKQIQQAAYQTAHGFLELGTELLSADEEEKKKHAKKLQALAIFQIGVNLSEEIQGIWKNANMNPLNSLIPGWGAVFATLQTVMATGRAAIGVGKVRSAKYETGGVLPGSRHSAGGNPVIDGQTGETIAELEAGEPYMILSRNTYANNRGIVDMLLYNSQYRNGAPIFESGGVLNPYKAAASAAATGGSQMPAGQGAAAVGAGQDPLSPQILAQLQQINGTLASWPTMVKAVLVYSELQAMEKEYDQVRTDAQVV